MRKLVLIGGGEHARSVAWAASSRSSSWLVGILDPHSVERTVALTRLPRLGGDDLIATLRDEHDFVLGIGAIGISAVRRSVMKASARLGARYAAVIHRDAIVAPSAVIEPGAVVLAGAVVGPGARIGAHAVVNTGAIVEHDCDIAELVQLAPGVVLGGGVRVLRDAFIGLGARIRDHVTIGERALVAMGATVVADVIDDSIVVGIPARKQSRRDDA